MARQTASRLVRYIGVDFGTNTSVLVCKDYLDDGEDPGGEVQKPEIDADSSGLKHLIPTAIFVDAAGRKSFGSKAEKIGTGGRGRPTNGSRFITNFKMDLISKDPDRRHAAEEEMEEFFRFLWGRYEDTRSFAASTSIVEERTCVSYPAKWPDAVRQRTLAAAVEAGFPKVRGMDEPSAAMQCFLSMETEAVRRLSKRGIIRAGAPLKILLLDMGAGTTDLVLFRYAPGAVEHEVLATWPPVDDPGTFGGREIDQRLLGVLRTLLHKTDPSKVESYLAQQSLAIREWKEEISRALTEQGETEVKPNFLTALESLGSDASILDFPRVTRAWVEKELLADYLPTLPRLLEGLFDVTQETAGAGKDEEIDLVVLTGGHCQWYFAREILAGTSRFWGDRSIKQLRKVSKEPERIVVTPTPQETVACGMALSGRPATIRKRAANNNWLEIKVSDAKPVVVDIVRRGELLPIRERPIYKRLPVRYIIDFSVGVEWTPLAGSSLRNALRGDTERVELSVTDLAEFIAVVLGKWFMDRVDDTADIFIDAHVDENEHLTASCLVKGGTGFDDFKVFSINAGPASDEERERLAQRYKAAVLAEGK